MLLWISMHPGGPHTNIHIHGESRREIFTKVYRLLLESQPKVEPGSPVSLWNTEIVSNSISLSPATVSFKDNYERLSFTVTVEDNPQRNGSVSYGYLVWTDEKGKYTVRSPIVVIWGHFGIWSINWSQTEEVWWASAWRWIEILANKVKIVGM